MRVIINCDPGHDDAIALMLAMGLEDVEVLAVCTTAGNQTLDKTTLNARKLLSFLGERVPVARGAAAPMCRELVTAPSVHGVSGLDGPELGEPLWPEHGAGALELMVEILESSLEPVTLISTGPLTNLGILLSSRPDLKSRIERVSLMGGAAVCGNWTAAAEYNIFVDPEAAHIVFSSGLPLIMAGLDVTHRAIVTVDEVERFRTLGNAAGRLTAELLDFFYYFHRESMPFLGGSPLHDVCAVAVLARPDIFQGRQAGVRVECAGAHTTGETVMDWRVETGKANVEVLLDLNREAFVSFLLEGIGRLQNYGRGARI